MEIYGYARRYATLINEIRYLLFYAFFCYIIMINVAYNGYTCKQCNKWIHVYSSSVEKMFNHLCLTCFRESYQHRLTELIQQGLENKVIRDILITEFHWTKRSASGRIRWARHRLTQAS